VSSLLNCQRRYQLHYVTRLRPLQRPGYFSLGAAYQTSLEHMDPLAGVAALRKERTIWDQKDQDRLDIDAAIVECCASLYLAKWPERDAERREYGYKVRLRNPWTGYFSRTYDLLGYADGLYPIAWDEPDAAYGLIENKLVAQVTAVSVKRLPLDRQLALACYGVWRATGIPVIHVNYRFVRKPSIQAQARTSRSPSSSSACAATTSSAPTSTALRRTWSAPRTISCAWRRSCGRGLTSCARPRPPASGPATPATAPTSGAAPTSPCAPATRTPAPCTRSSPRPRRPMPDPSIHPQQSEDPHVGCLDRACECVQAENERLRDAAQAVVDVHRRIIAAVTPGSPGWLGPSADDRERYNALFSQWHSTTRALRDVLAREPRE
jgi:uncharacterized protein YukE